MYPVHQRILVVTFGGRREWCKLEKSCLKSRERAGKHAQEQDMIVITSAHAAAVPPTPLELGVIPFLRWHTRKTSKSSKSMVWEPVRDWIWVIFQEKNHSKHLKSSFSFSPNLSFSYGTLTICTQKLLQTCFIRFYNNLSVKLFDNTHNFRAKNHTIIEKNPWKSNIIYQNFDILSMWVLSKSFTERWLKSQIKTCS